jgi:poly-gamma-glutamate synthesis protein (capsule biosynthesis protein)
MHKHNGRREPYKDFLRALLRPAAAPAFVLVMAALIFVLAACSADRGEGPDPSAEERGLTESSERQAPAERTGDDGESTHPGEARETGYEERAASGLLVPVAHLTSSREDVSPEELSRAEELAVPQEFEEAAEGSLEDPALEPFGVIHDFEAEHRGGAGAVREYLSGADLALANLENPVLQDAEWNPSGTTFHGDLRLLPIVEGFGIDGVTLANNHILDAGAEGLQETMGHLDGAGISYAGAGMNLSSAREPMIFDLGGLTVGVLSHQNVPYYEWSWAQENAPGTAPLIEDVLREDIRALRDEVDFTIVMPHWGEEYTATPEPGQEELARAAVEAGADLVVGNHAHWPKGMEVRQEKPVFYGTGNFLFDQNWSEETSTGLFAEVTLYEDRAVQARPVPFIILDRAQPNFLVAEEGGRRALETVFSTSVGPEFESYDRPPPSLRGE